MIKKISLNKLDIFVLVVITIVGVINLPTPFGGDQALFITGAKEIANGKVLYKDFWDLKPPGIFYFYYIAGTIFGFNEVGIHLLELIFWLIFSFFLIISLKSSNTFENKFSTSLVPLFTSGIYYSYSSVFSLTQVEGIINIFLFITLWLAVVSSKPNSNSILLLFFSGLLGAVIVIFKIIYLPLAGIFWLTVLLNLTFKQRKNFNEILKQYVLPLVVGFFLPLVILFLIYFKLDLLDIVYKTLFIYPSRIATEIPAGSYSSLYNLFLVYFTRFYLMLAFSVLGIFIGLWIKKDLLLTNIIIWFILGLILLSITKLSWWTYHLHLLNVPVGILFILSIDFVWSALKKNELVNSRKGKITAVIVLIILFQSFLHVFVGKTKFFMSYVSAPSEATRKQVIANFDDKANKYNYSYKIIKILNEHNSLTGEIYVAGHPLFYYLSGRSQAIPINGWILEILLPEQWNELNKQLIEKKPVYIFVDIKYMRLISNLSPETVKFIKENYSVVDNGKRGIWFANKEKLKRLN